MVDVLDVTGDRDEVEREQSGEYSAVVLYERAEALGFQPKFSGILTLGFRQPSENSKRPQAAHVGPLKVLQRSHGNFKTYRGWQQQRTREKEHFSVPRQSVRRKVLSHQDGKRQRLRRQMAGMSHSFPHVWRKLPLLPTRVMLEALPSNHLSSVFTFQSILISSM